MRLNAAIAMGALGLALAAPAHAQQQPRPDPFAQLDALFASGALVRGVVREEDVTLLFDHLRASILAASQGREAPPPPEALTRRGEEIAAEAKVRGTAASLILLNAFEGVAHQMVRDILAAPPSVSPPSR
jgi:hypothetical protein